MLKKCSIPQPGRIGVSGRKHQETFEVDPWGFGVGDTEDPRPAILQLRKIFWQHMKVFKLLQKWLARNLAPLSDLTAGPGLDVQREGPLYASCH